MGDSTPSSAAGGSAAAAAVKGETLKPEEIERSIRRTLRSPMVKFLKEKLEQSGCGIGRNFIKPGICPEPCAAGYIRGEGVVICANYVQYENEVEQAVIHELIHAYDDCRAANLDWSDCAHHACTEIRANHLSGDCRYKRELLRGHMKLKGGEPDCVKRRSLQSLIANPYCSEIASKEAIEAVWKTCYNDTAPFDRAP